MSYADFQVTGLIEPGTVGFASVDRIEVPKDEAGWPFAGPLTRLWVRHVMVMSDGLREYEEHEEAIDRAHGRVLVNGLGLGCFVKAILAKPEVEHVDVVDINADVIALTGRHYTDPRVNLICADAYEQARAWPRGTRWDCVWHDIWPTVDVDDLDGHARLLRSYGQRCGWQGAWIHEELQKKKRSGYVSVSHFAQRMREQYGVDVHIGSIPEWA